MKFPAGIDEGFEIYLHEGNLRVLNNGTRIEYLDLPLEIRRVFKEEMNNDLRAMTALRQMGRTAVDEMEISFVGCRYGSLNSKPDLTGTNTEPDAPCCEFMHGCCGFGFVCRIPDDLSRQEYLIAQYIGKGKLDKEICDILQITLPTCRTFQGRIHKKLHLNNRNEIAFWAQNSGAV